MKQPSRRTAAPGSPKNLVKALAVLRLISERPSGISLAEISRATGLPKPSAHRFLGALLADGLVRVNHDEVFSLGFQCLRLGTAFQDGLDLRREALGPLEELAKATGETCHLGVKDGHQIVYIEKIESSSAVRMYSRVGRTNPLHSTGLGKVIVAHSEPEAVDELIASGLSRRTDGTICDPDELRAELRRIKKRGVAYDLVENEEGIQCCGGPVFDHRGSVVAGISVAGPEYRLTAARLREITPAVIATALELSRRLGYHGNIPVGGSSRDLRSQRIVNLKGLRTTP